MGEKTLSLGGGLQRKSNVWGGTKKIGWRNMMGRCDVPTQQSNSSYIHWRYRRNMPPVVVDSWPSCTSYRYHLRIHPLNNQLLPNLLPSPKHIQALQTIKCYHRSTNLVWNHYHTVNNILCSTTYHHSLTATMICWCGKNCKWWW
jgi:hypothetical protein